MEVYVNLLANIIVTNYFSTTKCLYVFTDSKSTYKHFENIPAIIVDVELMRNNPNVYTKFYCDHFIINTEKANETFEEIENLIRYGENRFHFRSYLVLPTRNLDRNTTSIFETKSVDFVANILAVFPDKLSNSDEGIFNLYTHKYAAYHDYNQVYLLDKWFSKNSSFLFGNNLYPDKLSNQGGRILSIGTITYKPYSVIDYLDGTELSAVLEAACKYNMTITVTDFDGDWGDAFENFTGDGVLGNLARDKTDIGFASLFMYSSTYQYLDVTTPLVHTGITALVPSPKKETQPVKETAIITLLETEALFLGKPVSKLPLEFYSRIVYALAMILSLVMATIYTSGLASTMTVPKYKGTIRTLKDLAERGIHWGATSIVWIASISDSDNPIYQQIVKSFVIADVDNLTRLNSEEFGYAIERLQEGNYALGDYITEDGVKRRRLMDENLFNDYIVMYTRKGSILLPLINKVVLEVSQAGLVEYWEDLAISKYSSTTIQTIVRFSVQSPKPVITPLTFNHVEGAFIIWAVGIAISIICFIWEIKHK
ncbi:probable glutamate receptor [Onthophagus taurus]|uniref:probable glutamate receptor n=1 Tax=Onthophagus taurus TaxID=166361 RepID=UPI0039BE0C3D